MPSVSFQQWDTVRQAALDELEAAHRSLGGTGAGRRYATEQLNHAYTVLLSSQFQGFCRDLHSECADHVVQNVPAGLLRTVLRDVLVRDLKLKHGNPNAGAIGADYDRVGLDFWGNIKIQDPRNQRRLNGIEELNRWRNAIAHQDFNPAVLGTGFLRIERVRKWRGVCNQLAICFDEVMRSHVQAINGHAPW